MASARSFANVTLSLGLVNAPVKLFPAFSKDEVKFTYCDSDGAPVEQVYRRVDNGNIVGTAVDCSRSIEGRVIDQDHIAQITEAGKIEDDIELNKTLSIKKFIPLKTMPFERVSSCYNVAHDPKRGTATPLATIIKAMEKKKVAAVCKYVPRSSQCVAVLYAEKGRLKLVTLQFASAVNELPQEATATDDVKTDPGMVEIATQLIEATFDEQGEILSTMTDTATEAKRTLVDQVLQGEAPAPVEAKSSEAGVTDLMEALKASLEQTTKAAA